jgi:hypothetical protein
MAIFDDFTGMLGDAPAVHVFIAGVSKYSHFPNGGGALTANTYGMQQLTTMASAAWDFYQWLLKRGEAGKLPFRVGTVRVLLSPTDAELAKTPDMARAEGCTRIEFARNVRAWRESAIVNRGGFAIFYFAGHGVQRMPGDGLILMQDFGDPDEGTLARTVSINDVFWGMAPAKGMLDKTPLKQFYIVDACRERPPGFPLGEVASIWNGLPDGSDNRIAPRFVIVSGAQAFEQAGEEAFFSKRIMKCLQGAGGVTHEDPPKEWEVDVHSLSEALSYETDQLLKDKGVELSWTAEGSVKNMTLHKLDGPPNVSLNLRVDPADQLPKVQLRILDGADRAVYEKKPVNPHPDAIELPAGKYRVEATVDGAVKFSDTLKLQPPRSSDCLAKVST